MLLVLITWLLVFYVNFCFGSFAKKIFKLKELSFLCQFILGLFFLGIIANFWAFFYRINWEFFLLIFLFSVGFTIVEFVKIQAQLRSIKIQFLELQNWLKILLVILFFYILAQTSAESYLVDNESYYVQTIKWFSEFGIVKGIANLHLFLGQASGWHLTQSIFDFSFTGRTFNDLNSLFYLIFVLYSFGRLNRFFQTKNCLDLSFGIVPIFSALFYQLISSPNPDLPIVLISFLLLDIFIKHYKTFNYNHFKKALLLFLFMMFVKVTPIIFVLIPIFIFVKIQKQLNFKDYLLCFFTSLVVLLLYLGKNYWISGHVFFPSSLFSNYFNPDWKLPSVLQNFYYEFTESCSLGVWIDDYKQINGIAYVKHWLTMGALDSIMNTATVVLFLLIPVVFIKKKVPKPFWFTYVLAILHMLLMFKTSPQYRFYLQIILWFSATGFALILPNQKIVKTVFALIILASGYVVFFPIQLNHFTNNQLAMQLSNFNHKQLLVPHKPSKYKANYQIDSIQNIQYFHPKKTSFIFEAANAPLPATNKELLQYIQQYFQYIPQQRTTKIQDGFYSKKLYKNKDQFKHKKAK